MGEDEAFVPNSRVRGKFINWIEQFDNRHARAWAHRYNDDPQGAMCEAMYWGVLSDCGVEVWPNADLEGGKPGPDFKCRKDGCDFYVEVTCIRIETASSATGLRHVLDPKHGASAYAPLNEAIFNECVSKTRQCSGLDAPCVLAVGTFHLEASVLCFRKHFVEQLLTGKAMIAWYPNLGHGRPSDETWQETAFDKASFVRLSRLQGLEHCRKPISALLVGGFGCTSPRVLGLIHPNPVREFRFEQLDCIPFCQLKIDLLNGTCSTRWTKEFAD